MSVLLFRLESLLTLFQNLASVDSYRYDEAWELPAADAITEYSKDDRATPSTVLIDLRKPDDFISSNVPGSYNLPLQSLNSSTSSPFFDATILERQWKELNAMFSDNTISAYDLSDKNVGVICYDGDTARVATSVLRAKGIAASSIKGGFQALVDQLPNLQKQNSLSFEQWAKTPDVEARGLEPDSISSDPASRREVVVNAL
jgi:cysteine synthase A